MNFFKKAKEFARNPLGIIALFISLIYGFASLLLNSSADKLTEPERWPLIIFIVVFPVMVLVAFYKLVTKHHGKLYAPGDYKDDKSFLRTLTPDEQEKKLDKEVKESLGESDAEDEGDDAPASSEQSLPESVIAKDREKRIEGNRRFRDELKIIESAVVEMISSEYKVKADFNIGIGETDAHFDAMLHTSGIITFIEVKALRRPIPFSMVLDRLLYHAVVADKFFDSNFKLIIAIVYYFDDNELGRVEKIWRRRVEKCPANIELRFIPKSKVIKT